MERPDYATLRELKPAHVVEDAMSLPLFDEALEHPPWLQLAVEERYTPDPLTRDYIISYVLVWRVTSSPVFTGPDMDPFDSTPPATLASGEFPLGSTLYADLAADFTFAPLFYTDPVVASTIRQEPYGPDAALERARQEVRNGLFDAPASEHRDLLIASVIVPYALELAYEYEQFYTTRPQRQAAALSPLNHTWFNAWSNYGAGSDVITVQAVHSTLTEGVDRTTHYMLVNVYAERETAYGNSQQFLTGFNYAFAEESESALAATEGIRFSIPEGRAAVLMRANHKRFRGLDRAHRFVLFENPRFVANDMRDHPKLEASVIAPLLWSALIALKERAGDIDTDELSSSLTNVTHARHAVHDASVLAPASTRAVDEAPPATLPAVRRLARILQPLVGNLLPFVVPEDARHAPPSSRDALFELAAVDVRYAGIPRRATPGTIEYRPPGKNRRLVSISMVLRVRDAAALLALPPDAVVMELWAPRLTEAGRVPQLGAEELFRGASHIEGFTLATVRKNMLRVNALYDDATNTPLSALTHVVVAFVVPITRFYDTTERIQSDAVQLAHYLAVTASLAEVYWLDALLARLSHTERASVAVRETRTFEYATTMPRIDAAFPLTDGVRHTLAVPYYAALVTEATGTVWSVALADAPSGTSAIEGAARERLKLASPSAGKEAKLVGIHGHAHAVLASPALRGWAMRWHRATDLPSDKPRDASSPESYYYGAATHEPDRSPVPFDDQRLEAEYNARFAQMLFAPERQRSLDIRLRNRNGTLTESRIYDSYARFFPAPVAYDDYYDIVTDV